MATTQLTLADLKTGFSAQMAAVLIDSGVAVGENGSGYARTLSAGDHFMGFSEGKVDNSAGAAGAQRIGLIVRGFVKLNVSGLAITSNDGRVPVYASDGTTFTTTKGSNTYIGRVVEWVSSGVAWVHFDAYRGALSGLTEFTNSTGGSSSDTLAAGTNTDALTDSSGGTADDTIEAVGATNSGDVSGAINNNFKEMADQLATQRALNTVLINSVTSLGDKINDLLRQIG